MKISLLRHAGEKRDEYGGDLRTDLVHAHDDGEGNEGHTNPYSTAVAPELSAAKRRTVSPMGLLPFIVVPTLTTTRETPA